MAGFTEKTLVEDYIVEKLRERGWKFVKADGLERETLDESLLVPNLIRALKRINEKLGIGDEEIRQVLNELKFRGTGIEGIKQILNFLKYGVPVKFEREKVVKYVQLLDHAHPERNEFILSRQVWFHGKEPIRCDIVLFINSIPLVVIECKNPADLSTSWVDAYKDIKDYEELAPELFKYAQIGVAAEETARCFPIVPWDKIVDTQEWRHEPMGSLDSLIEMLTAPTLLDLVRNYVFFRVERGKATKVIARYMQYRAAEKIVDRVLKYLKGEQRKNKGLIWHWQGSGKTLTMIFAAHKLYHLPELGNPSLFFIVDREELETQLYEEFAALDISKPEVIDSINELRKVLRFDNWRGKRGIFITLIHKFRPEELEEVTKELEALSEQRETIANRKNVVAFVDEGHRSQYGLLAAQMKNTLRGAGSFAFTGTPIAKAGRDTYEEFSYLPEEKYLDKYFITDSIHDGFTLRIVYQPRLEKDVHLKKEQLDAFLQVEFEEIPEEIRQRVEERVRKRLNTIRIFLENPDRIEKIIQDIARHFKENLDGRFKAMVVAVSRHACVLYKRALDKLLPAEYSEVVMTYGQSDPESVSTYWAELRARFPGKDLQEINREIVTRFKEEENPGLLIVTDMLLTGFDAPILQTIYLDKPLKEHRLLQAVARTNRPYEDVKEFGVVLDYVGILKDFHRAFEIYSKEDIKGALEDAGKLRDEFVRKMKDILRLFEGVPKERFDRAIMLQAVHAITSAEGKGKRFVREYKKLRHLFEILGPDVIKVKLFQDYKWITKVYEYYVKTLRRAEYEALPWENYYAKTLKFIYKSTELENLNEELPEIKFDQNYLKALEDKVKSREEKAANIVFTLNRFVLVDRRRTPIYESLADRVERLVQVWREKTKDFETIYREGVDLFKEIQLLSERQRRLGLSDTGFSILLALEEKLGKKKEIEQDAKELLGTLDGLLFPGWIDQPTARKRIEREIRRFLRRYITKAVRVGKGLVSESSAPYGPRIGTKFIDDATNRIFESLKRYGTAR